MSNLSGYLQYRFGNDGARSGDEWRTTCPRCHNEGRKMFVNCVTGAANCKHCDLKIGEGWVPLIARVEGLHGREAISRWIADHRHELEGLRSDGESSYKRTMPKLLPTGCASIPCTPDDVFFAYLRRRGFDVADVIDYDMMACRDGKYANRIIVPVYAMHDGNVSLDYFFDRTVLPEDRDSRKTLGIGGADYRWPVDKSSVVFNLHTVACGDTVLITEGVFSAISAAKMTGLHAVALLGKVCSASQLDMIRMASPGRVELALDPDARKQTMELADRLAAWGIPVRVRLLGGGMDPNDYLVSGVPMPSALPWGMATRYMVTKEMRVYA